MNFSSRGRVVVAALALLAAASGAQPAAEKCDGNLQNYAKEDNAVRRAERMLAAAWKCWLEFESYDARHLNAQGGGMSRNAPRGGGPKPQFEDGRMSIIAMSGLKATFPVEQIMLLAAYNLRENYKPLPFDVAGEADFLKARTLGQEAHRVAPSAKGFRFLAQLAVAQSKWAELMTLARDQVRRDPRDAWARMSLTLAQYRINPGQQAAASFDSALAMMPPEERARLDRFERLLRPREAAQFAKLDSVRRKASISATWLLADPLWSTKQADPRAEFLARITFAELRWTIDDKRRGADSDRGDIYIRYGPPNQVMSYVGTNTQVGHLFWVYNAGIAFAFTKQMHYGTAELAAADIRTEVIQRMKDWVPARWDNIATSRIDSMPTQLARFRSGPDTVEVFLATRAPMEALQLAGTSNVPPTAHLWLYGLDSPTAFVDSATVGASGKLEWTRRLGAGAYYYRVEAMIPGTAVAGRAASGMQMGGDTTTGFAMRGFGLSDVLLATRINSTGTARRWVDFDAEPLLGSVKQGSQLTLVWENYELGQREQAAGYEVLVTIERGQSAVGKIAAQIVSRVASMIGVDASDDKLAMKFERTVPYAPTIPDNITIALGDTPAGTYLMTLRITDRITGRGTSRAMTLVIRE